MNLLFSPIDQWPEGWDPAKPSRLWSPFKADYDNTLNILDRELWQLHAINEALQVDASASGVRRDGQFAANATVRYPGVILRFEMPKLGVVTYPCNKFNKWQDNVRAIALGLEALRKVERYGIAERGQQYAGFAKLGSGIAMGPHKMTRDEALKILSEGAGEFVSGSSPSPSIEFFYREAAKRHHPDKGGNPDTFRKLTEARDLLIGAKS